jgi:hypothetical protein
MPVSSATKASSEAGTVVCKTEEQSEATAEPAQPEVAELEANEMEVTKQVTESSSDSGSDC